MVPANELPIVKKNAYNGDEIYRHHHKKGCVHVIRYLILVVVGLLMGTATVSLGGGAGSVYVSILTLFFGVSPAIATSTSLATMFPTAAASAYLHGKAGHINYKIGGLMIGWGAIGALIGSLSSSMIPDNWYNKLIGVVILGLTALMILKKQRPHTGTPRPTIRIQHLQAAVFGMIGGVLSGLVGTSGTTAFIAGLTVLGCTTMETVGTSVFILSGISLIGFLMRIGVGSVDWCLATILAGSAVLGALIGALFLRKLIKPKAASQNSRTIDITIILCNLLMGGALLFK